MLLYYITDRTQFSGDEASRRAKLLDRIGSAARAGVNYIQLREKDLPARELETLAREAVERVRAAGQKTWLLVNSRVDVALAAGADGVHLPAGDISPIDARRIFAAAGINAAIIGVSCHSVDEVRRALAEGADVAVFGPVFEKDGAAGVGLKRLGEACAASPGLPVLPVLALGGVTPENAGECVRAGAAGVAGIRLFQNGDLERTLTAFGSMQ